MQAVYYLYAIVWLRRVEIQQHHKSENVIKPTGRELPAAAAADQSALFARLCCNKSIYQFIFSLHMKSEGCSPLVYGMHCLSFMTNEAKASNSLTFSLCLVLWPKEHLKQPRDWHTSKTFSTFH